MGSMCPSGCCGRRTWCGSALSIGQAGRLVVALSRALRSGLDPLHLSPQQMLHAFSPRPFRPSRACTITAHSELRASPPAGLSSRARRAFMDLNMQATREAYTPKAVVWQVRLVCGWVCVDEGHGRGPWAECERRRLLKR